MHGEPSAEAGAPRDELPAPGDTVAGKYVVTRKLDEGGMGVLFAATHRALNQPVAIKFLKPKYAREAGSRERFLREARAAAAITSEHAARIQDVDETPQGVPFIVMELLRGADLGKVLSDHGKLPWRDAVGYVLQACEAVAEAHAAGVVHRDLKPSNLFLAERPDGTSIVKVLDFGISKSVVQAGDARDAAGGTSLTAPNTLLGSPQYMSPEQVRNAKGVDRRSDVWALGVILYELVTGAPPFDAASAGELFAKILTDKPFPMRRLAPDAPSGLSDVVLRCLVKDPDGRTKGVADLALALRPFAPAGSDARVDRIVRVLARSPESIAPGSVRDTVDAQAVVASGGRSRGARVATVGALGVVLLAAAFVYARSAVPPGADAKGGQVSPSVPVGVGASAPSPSVSPAVPVAAAPPSAPPPVVAPESPPEAPVERRPAPAPRGSAAAPKVKDLSQIRLLQ